MKPHPNGSLQKYYGFGESSVVRVMILLILTNILGLTENYSGNST